MLSDEPLKLINEGLFANGLNNSILFSMKFTMDRQVNTFLMVATFILWWPEVFHCVETND
jgi:hypothetical protein